MNPFKLVREGTTDPVAQACGKCGRVYRLDSEYESLSAVECCDAEAYQARREREAEERGANYAVHEAERAAKAKTVPEAEYDGPVWADGFGHSDGYFASVDELREWCNDEECALPGAVWTCTRKPFALPKASEIIESELENGEYHDGCAPDDDDAGLQAAIDAYNARQTDETWTSSNTRVLLAAPISPTH